MKYLSLFSGIGSPEQALKNLGVKFELVGFSEIDKFAIKSYCAVHEVDEKLNLGDISKIDIEKLPEDIDLITHGSPCTDFSVAGKGLGGDEGTGTRSSLMWNTVAICEHCQPKYVVWENVKNVLSKKHKHNFNKYLNEMDRIGYNNFYKVLNAKDYGVPQNRERIFVISIRKDIEKTFKFPKASNSTIKLKDILEDDKKTESYRIIRDDIVFKDMEITECEPKPIRIGTINKGGQGDRIYSPLGHAITLSAEGGGSGAKTGAYLINGYIRKLTPKECWRLMGFKDKQFEKAKEVCSNSQLYKQAGNSIVVNVMEEIFKNLL